MSADEFHRHKPRDVKPQGIGSGLDSDKVDGLHASELGGGGPHASSHETGGADEVHLADLEHDDLDSTLHDALTSTPHISQAEKDKIHDRLHALNSALDHSGSLGAGQHGALNDGDHTGNLSGNARVKVRRNSGADIGTRRRLNFIEGSNVTLTIADDSVNEEVDITVASSGGGGGPPEGIVMGCMFMAFGGFEVYSTGGTVTKYSWGVKVVSSAASPYKGYAFYNYNALSPAIFDKNPQFELYLNFDSTDYDVWVMIGGSAGAFNTASEKKFGIHVEAGALKTISSDGTTQTESASLMTLSSGTWYRIRCKLTSGSQIEVWVDGVSKGTKTTNLPTGSVGSAACPQIITLGESGLPETAYTAGLKVMHDY